MKELKESHPYELIKITDNTMGITSTDVRARTKERGHFLSMMGSDTFWFSRYKYSPLGSAASYVVVFKIDYGASITNESVVQARASAEQNTPVYYSLRETKDAIRMIRISTEDNKQLAYATLGTILPDNIAMNTPLPKKEKELINSVTSLL